MSVIARGIANFLCTEKSFKTVQYPLFSQIQVESCRQEMAEKASLLLEASAALQTLEDKIRQMEQLQKQFENPTTEGSAANSFRLLPPPPQSPAAEQRRRMTSSPLAARKGFFFSDDLANNNNNNNNNTMMLKEADRLVLAVLEETGMGGSVVQSPDC